ncbi:hypothetical protein Unana1_02299 [Umbelopsis nana]
MDQQPSIVIPTQPARPNVITWSEHNQLAITTLSSVHILTPVVTKKGDKSSLQFQQGVLTHENQPESKRFDTVDSDTPSFMTSFAVYNGFRCAIWAPAGIANRKGCLLTVVTVNHRVLMYQQGTPKDNTTWILARELTYILGQAKDPKSHALCAAWSKSTVFEHAPSAVLAVGTKSGHIALWNDKLEDKYIFHHLVFSDSTVWITLLEWTLWRKDGHGQSAYLFVGASDGRVACLKVGLKKDKITSTVLHKWFEDDSRMPTFIKLTGSEETGVGTLKVAIAKSSSIHVAELSVAKNGNLQLNGDKFISRNLPISTIFTGGTWSRDGNTLNVISSEYANYSLFVEEQELKINEEYTKQMHTRTNTALRAQAYEMAKKEKSSESTTNESYQATIGGIDLSPNGLYLSIHYVLTPTIDTDSKDTGPDSWCACVLDVLDAAQARPLLIQSILNRLSHRSDQGNRDIFDLVDYMAAHDPDPGLLQLMTGVKAFLDAQPHPEVTPASTKNLDHLVNDNWRINSAKLLCYIYEHLKAYTVPKNVSDRAKELADAAKVVTSSFYDEVLLQMYVSRSETAIRAFTPQQIADALMTADSALVLYPQDDRLLKLAQQFYHRLCKLKIGVGSIEADLAASLRTKKRLSIEPGELPPREQCPSCQDHILSSSTLNFPFENSRRLSEWAYVGTMPSVEEGPG